MAIRRQSENISVGLATTQLSNPIPCSGWGTTTIQMPTTKASATFTYDTTNKVDANGDPTKWAAAVDYTGAAIGNITCTADTPIPVDPRVAQCRFVRISLASAETIATFDIQVHYQG